MDLWQSRVLLTRLTQFSGRNKTAETLKQHRMWGQWLAEYNIFIYITPKTKESNTKQYRIATTLYFTMSLSIEKKNVPQNKKNIEIFYSNSVCKFQTQQRTCSTWHCSIVLCKRQERICWKFMENNESCQSHKPWIFLFHFARSFFLHNFWSGREIGISTVEKYTISSCQ